MCKETFEVSGLDDQRTAYEIEQHLLGLKYVDSATADFIDNELTIEYDEMQLSHDKIVREIEQSGCSIGQQKSILGRLRDTIES